MKTTLSIEQIKNLATDVMLELNDTEIEELKAEFYIILQQMNKVETIDTTSIPMMHYPILKHCTHLRSDDEFKMIDKKAILNNAPDHDQDYIVIGKVID